METDKVVRLICCCCGAVTTGRQWHNRDTGFGLCGSCAISIKNKETAEEMRSNYGVDGVHYFSSVADDKAAD